MWLFTNFGFFSIVNKRGDEDLTVRARVAADLHRLRDEYLPDLSPTLERIGTDYPFRATVAREALANALSAIVRGIDYSNFKDEVSRCLGSKRAGVYHDIWSVAQALESEK